MSARHDAIGIKQIIRLEWLERAASLQLSGMDKKNIRKELHEFLSDRKGDGSTQERGATARGQVVNILMNIWVKPNPELIPFRDALLEVLKVEGIRSLPTHWAMISAAYPFWFNVAIKTGRLLALQDEITKMQLEKRLKEQYGDRQTVSRYARYTIRSFVSWGVLAEAKEKGCYKAVSATTVDSHALTALMIESALHTIPSGKTTISEIFGNPGFFAFGLDAMVGSMIAQLDPRIEVDRYGLDEELLKLVKGG